MAAKRDMDRRIRKAKAQLNVAKQMATLAKDDPRIVRDLARGVLAQARTKLAAPIAAPLTRTGAEALPSPAEPALPTETAGAPQVARPPRENPDLAAFDRTATATFVTTASPRQVIDAAADIPSWPQWFGLHSSWTADPPATAQPGDRFGQQAKILGIPVELEWTVAVREDDRLRLDGAGRMGVGLSLFVEARADGGRTDVWIDIGMGGDPLRGPMGATAQRAVQDALDQSATRFAQRAGAAVTRSGPIVHARTGATLDARTPVIVGAGQFVQRDPDPNGELLDPVALSSRAVHEAASDAGAPALPRRADAVYAVASTSWTYRDQAALVADAIGASPRATVVSARFGGDGALLLLNAAAQAIADGEHDVVLLTGAESGATLAAAQKAGRTPPWPEQPAGTTPTRTLGSDGEASNAAESAAGLNVPIYVYALLESAVRGKAGATPAEHQRRIAELWARFSEVAAKNPYAWQPEVMTADELATSGADNRLVSAPYPKMLCANLQVDMASALIVCSAQAATEAGIPQDKWVFLHAGASGADEWFVSERADLAASPAIGTLGRAALQHAGITADDLGPVDLYACFPSAVQIAAAELGLPIDDPARPLTMTGGLTFGGGPGNNYGGHGVASLVPQLRAAPGTYGLATALGWFVTKHSLVVLSANPPARPYAHLHPVIEHPPARPVRTDYTGPAVIEAYTLPYGRDGEPEAAIVSAITTDGARVLVRTTQPDVVAALADGDAVRRCATIEGPTALTLDNTARAALPAPPEPPLLVERRGPVTVLTLNRPEVRNAVDRRTALLLERALDAFDTDPQARVAVLTGAGAAFSSGMDLKAAARGEFPLSERRGPLGITAVPPVKPVIAAVEGPALAGGCELALACDLVIASRDSQFGLPEPKRGLVAAAGGILRIAQRLPRAIALELALIGDPLPATRMAELGIVNRVVEPGTALATALELAERIAANAPMSVAIGKRIVDESPDWSQAEAFDRQTELAAPALTSDDAREGVLAFAEKRAPRWTGH